MTDEERDALLLDVADGFRMVIESMETSNRNPTPQLRALRGKLSKFLKEQRFRDIPDPHNILGLRK